MCLVNISSKRPKYTWYSTIRNIIKWAIQQESPLWYPSTPIFLLILQLLKQNRFFLAIELLRTLICSFVPDFGNRFFPLEEFREYSLRRGSRCSKSLAIRPYLFRYNLIALLGKIFKANLSGLGIIVFLLGRMKICFLLGGLDRFLWGVLRFFIRVRLCSSFIIYIV